MLHRLALAALLGTLALPAGARERLVLVPFERVARATAARDVLMPALAAALLAKGYDVVAGPEVEEFLRKRRIRWLDSLSRAHAAELLSAFDASGVVLGTILAWGPDRIDPHVALTVRVLGRDGMVLWSDLAGLSVSETEGALGVGKVRGIEELGRRTAASLVVTLPAGRLAPVRVARSAGLAQLPRVFRDRDRIGSRLRICVLPLQNHTESRDPPRILDAVLQHRLAERKDLTPVPAAELRDALGKTGVHVPAQYLTVEQLRDRRRPPRPRERRARHGERSAARVHAPPRRDGQVPRRGRGGAQVPRSAREPPRARAGGLPARATRVVRRAGVGRKVPDAADDRALPARAGRGQDQPHRRRGEGHLGRAPRPARGARGGRPDTRGGGGGARRDHRERRHGGDRAEAIPLRIGDARRDGDRRLGRGGSPRARPARAAAPRGERGLPDRGRLGRGPRREAEEARAAALRDCGAEDPAGTEAPATGPARGGAVPRVVGQVRRSRSRVPTDRGRPEAWSGAQGPEDRKST